MSTPEYNETKILTPLVTIKLIETPQESHIEIPNPLYKDTTTPPPKVGHLLNVVMFGNEEIEIKPTKLKYQRDKTASFYRILQQIPLVDILTFEQGMLDELKTSDKLLFDWLIAVTDDPLLVKRNYDLIDSDTVLKILEIFCRLNHITEKEERKNKKAQERNP